jgi:protein-disulfide isomerase
MRDVSEDDYYEGNLDAPVKIVYYSDFECPFCPDYVDNIKKIKEEYGDDILFVFRHFILSSHRQALTPALAFECAAEQNRAMDMYYALYNDSREQKLNREEFMLDAEELDLDIEKFTTCLDTEKYRDRVSKLVQEAKSYGVSGTPATYINGKSYPGAYPYEDFVDQLGKEQKGLKSIIEEELQK